MKKGSGLLKFIVVFVIAAFFLCSNSSDSNLPSSPSYPNSSSAYSSYSIRAYTPSTSQKPKYTCSDGTTYDSFSSYQDCQNRYNWKLQRDKSLEECNADSSKFNCWYDEYPGTTLHWEYYVNTPSYNYQTPSSNSSRYGAICKDGTHSNATGRGACSHHGGVSMWLTY